MPLGPRLRVRMSFLAWLTSPSSGVSKVNESAVSFRTTPAETAPELRVTKVLSKPVVIWAFGNTMLSSKCSRVAREASPSSFGPALPPESFPI